MNFDLADLRAFVAVVKLRSFRAAAAEMHLSQPALSRRIDKLERALGVRLLKRTTRKVDVTGVGREFSARAERVLNGLEESLLGMRDVARRVTGEITLACMPSAIRYFLPAILREYHARYPGILVRVIDQGAHDMLGVVGHDYMTVTRASGNRMLIDMALTHAANRPRWFCEAQHVSTLVDFVEAGLGIAAVPELAMPPAGHATLVSVPLLDPAVTRPVGLIRRAGRELPPASRLLYDAIRASRRAR